MPGWSIGHEQERDAAVLRRADGSVRASRKIQLASRGQRGPDLLAVDHPLVAVEHGTRGERAEIGAGVGLGVALAPAVLAREDARAGSGAVCSSVPHRNSVLPTILMPKVSYGAPGGNAGPGELLGQHDLLELGQPAAAVRPRPGDAEEPVLEQRAPPLGRRSAPRCHAPTNRCRSIRAATVRPGTCGPGRGTLPRRAGTRASTATGGEPSSVTTRQTAPRSARPLSRMMAR